MAPEASRAGQLVWEAPDEADLFTRQMKLLDAEIVLEEGQPVFLKRLERATVELERYSRW